MFPRRARVDLHPDPAVVEPQLDDASLGEEIACVAYRQGVARRSEAIENRTQAQMLGRTDECDLARASPV